MKEWRGLWDGYITLSSSQGVVSLLLLFALSVLSFVSISSRLKKGNQRAKRDSIFKFLSRL